ncbi:MAG: cyclic nucleotide-binding domain-containing protein [Deltaproteobacteria bacterium]|nr:cyclic nucleotide-binding domain-containing protein [Deltaproteobacteria bacterium]
MMPITSQETYQDGDVIYEEGSYGDWLYVISKGQVEISKKVGNSKVVIETLTEGDIFGELAFLANIPRTATASSIGETTVGLVDREFLDAEYNKISQYFRHIIKSLVLRLQKTTDALANFKK